MTLTQLNLAMKAIKGFGLIAVMGLGLHANTTIQKQGKVSVFTQPEHRKIDQRTPNGSKSGWTIKSTA